MKPFRLWVSPMKWFAFWTVVV